jgi:hypothetical protein
MPRNTPRFRLKSPGKLQLSESDVTKACLDLLRAHRWWPIRQHVGKFLTPRVLSLLCPECRSALHKAHWITIGETGDPDYALIKAPSFMLEFKRPGGELSLAQRDRIYQLRQFFGLETVVVEDVEELSEWLNRYERSP